MTLLNTSLVRKMPLFLVAVMFSLSAVAVDFNQVQRSANQGDSDAQFKLAVMYNDGTGVPQNYTKAAEWYTKAANQGDSDAQFNLGVIYGKGQGVRQDYAKAAEWYQKAANQSPSRILCNCYLLTCISSYTKFWKVSKFGKTSAYH